MNDVTTCEKVLKFLIEINNANLSGSNEGDPRSLNAFGYEKNNIFENWPDEKEEGKTVGSAYLYTGDGSPSSSNARPYFIEGYDISKGSPFDLSLEGYLTEVFYNNEYLGIYVCKTPAEFCADGYIRQEHLYHQ